MLEVVGITTVGATFVDGAGVGTRTTCVVEGVEAGCCDGELDGKGTTVGVEGIIGSTFELGVGTMTADEEALCACVVGLATVVCAEDIIGVGTTGATFEEAAGVGIICCELEEIDLGCNVVEEASEVSF